MFVRTKPHMVDLDLHYKLDLKFERAMNGLFIEIGYLDKNNLLKHSKEFIYISKLYSRFISDVKIVNLRKIDIQLVNSQDSTRIINSNQLTKVCLIYKYFDWQNFEKETIEINRFKIILDLILDTLLEFYKEFNWPIAEFRNAYSQVIQAGFRNEYVLLAPKVSKNKRYHASLVGVSSIEYNSIFIELTDVIKENETKRFELMKISMYEEDLSIIAKTLKWINNDEFIISNKDKEINFKVSIGSELPELFLTPRIHDERYLLDELKLLDPETSPEEYLLINNRRIANLSSLKTS